MRYLIIALSLIVLIQFSACKKDATSKPKTLTGTWTLSRSLISSGGPTYWVPAANNNDYIQFKANGTVAGTILTDYSVYVIKDSVTLTVTSADKSKYEDYRYRLTSDSLTMSPIGPTICIEGCAIQLVKAK